MPGIFSAGHLNGNETDSLMLLVEKSNTVLSKRVRVGFVNASLTDSSTGGQIGGRAKKVGSDPCLVSLENFSRIKLNILAHEVGHASSLSHNFLYDPNINHWLMRESAGSKWSNDSKAAKRFYRLDADNIKNYSSYDVPFQ